MIVARSCRRWTPNYRLRQLLLLLVLMLLMLLILMLMHHRHPQPAEPLRRPRVEAVAPFAVLPVQFVEALLDLAPPRAGEALVELREVVGAAVVHRRPRHRPAVRGVERADARVRNFSNAPLPPP